MLTHTEVKPKIFAEWRSWLAQNNKQNPKSLDAFVFYGYLQKEHGYLLNFRAIGDKWQMVHNWLLEAGLVAD